jgi:hypothetical protein
LGVKGPQPPPAHYPLPWHQRRHYS